MELALNTGAFEALDQQEMYDVDGGFAWGAFWLGCAAGAGVVVVAALVVAGCVYLYNLGYSNGYNSTRG